MLDCDWSSDVCSSDLDLKVSHLMTLASPRLSRKEIADLKKALAAFSSDSRAGAEFFRNTGYLGYEEISTADLKSLQPYVDLTMRVIGSYQP
jgi:hypothetical protein